MLSIHVLIFLKKKGCMRARQKSTIFVYLFEEEILGMIGNTNK